MGKANKTYNPVNSYVSTGYTIGTSVGDTAVMRAVGSELKGLSKGLTKGSFLGVSLALDIGSASIDVGNGNYKQAAITGFGAVGSIVGVAVGGFVLGALTVSTGGVVLPLIVAGAGAYLGSEVGKSFGKEILGVDKVDADDATKGKYEGSLDSAEQSYKDYTRPKNTGSSGSNSPGDDPTPAPPTTAAEKVGTMGAAYPIVLDLDGAVSPSGVASHEPLPIISGAALGGDEVVIHSLSLSRVASSSPTQTILRLA